MAANEFEIKLLANLDQLNKAFDKIGKVLEKQTEEVVKGNKKVATSFDKIKDAAEAGFATFLTGKLSKFIGGFVDEAKESLKVTKQLGFAFKASGIDVEKGVDNLSQFAKQLQKTTSLSDEFVLSVASQIQAIRPLGTVHLKQATKAIIDFSLATGQSTEAAASAFAKGIGGNTRSLLQYGIVVKKSKDETEQFNNVLKGFERFSGSADKTLTTFSGATTRLANAYGEVQEEIGKAIIKSPVLIALINKTADVFFEFADVAETRLAPAIKGVINLLGKVLTPIVSLLPELFIGAASAATAFTVILAGSKISALVAGFSRLNLAVTAFVAVMGIALTTATKLFNTFSFFDSVKVLFAGFKILILDTFGAIFKGFKLITDQLAKLPKIGGFFKALSDDAVKELKTIEKVTTKIGLDLVELAKPKELQIIVDKKVAEQKLEKEVLLKLKLEAINELESQLKSMNESIKNAGLTQRQIIEKDYKDRIEIINKANKIGAQLEGGNNNLRLLVQKKYNDDIKKLEEEEAKKRKDIIETAGKDITAFINNFKNLDKNGQLTAGVNAVINSVSAGAEGARKAVVGVLTQGITKLLGPLGEAFGPIVGQFLDVLSQGPEKVRALIQEFLRNIPIVIENIILAIPVLIETIAQELPSVIEKLNSLIPRLLPSLITTFARIAPIVAVSLAAQAPLIATSFAVELIKQAPAIAQALIDAAKSLIPGASSLSKLPGGSSGGGGGGFLGSVLDFLNPFAEGGVVPSGYSNDTFPAKLTSGEAVVPNNVVDKLESFLNSGGQNQNVTINLQIGEQQLASVLLNLNRRGFRTS